MATTKKLNSFDIEEFLQTDAGKEALAIYCFEKGFLSKQKHIVVSEIKIPVKASATVSLTTLTPFEFVLRHDEEIRAKLNKMSDQSKIAVMRESMSVGIEEADSFYNEIGERAWNCIRAAKIETISCLVQYTPEELLKFRNFGEVSLTAVMNWFHKRNFCLGMDNNVFRFQ